MWGVRGYLAGWRETEFARFCEILATERLLPRVATEGRRLLDKHRERGDLIVLMTGAPAQLAEPLGRLLRSDVVVAGRLAIDVESLTGWMLAPTPRGREKARHIRTLARQYHLDLQRSWAYANTWGDAPHMALTGHPVAVNPGPLLVRAAARRGWPVQYWLPPGDERNERG